MGHNFNRRSAQQQRHLAERAQKVDANHFFNLLTDPRMLETVEAQLPEHRERQFPPTLTLAMFLGQIMSADGSCQNAVNEASRRTPVGRDESREREHQRLLPGAPTLAPGDGRYAGATKRRAAR